MPAALGSTRAEARTNADALFGALASRFDSVERAPRFFQARSKLGRYALSPRGVFGDTSVWTAAPTDSARVLTLAGISRPSGYLFTPRPNAPLPIVIADSRHVIALRRQGDGEYEWDTAVDQAIGPITSREVAGAITAFIASAERTSDARVRIDHRALFPRTTRVAGDLFTLDTVRTSALADRSTQVLVRFHLDPSRVKNTRPNFAKYLEKYVSPARYRIRLQDGRGSTFLDAVGAENVFSIRCRVRDGKLLALTGEAQPMPDSLQIAVDFSAKFMIFRVGVTSLIGDFAMVRTADERGWMMRFRREPDWHFPLAVNNLIRTSLRHPFEGDGMTLRISIRDREGAPTLLSRTASVSVQESAIVRWLGGLGNSAMSDFAGRAEAEENRYLFDILSALRTDLVTALGAGDGD